jgi:hypothetical protein
VVIALTLGGIYTKWSLINWAAIFEFPCWYGSPPTASAGPGLGGAAAAVLVVASYVSSVVGLASPRWGGAARGRATLALTRATKRSMSPLAGSVAWGQSKPGEALGGIYGLYLIFLKLCLVLCFALGHCHVDLLSLQLTSTLPLVTHASKLVALGFLGMRHHSR